MIKLELPEQMIAIIGKALGAQPHDMVRATIDEMQKQINEQQQSHGLSNGQQAIVTPPPD